MKNCARGTTGVSSSTLTTLTRIFGLDLRSLALLRIGMAMLVLGDLADRAVFLRVHYTDFGFFTRADAARAQSEAQWSLHLTAGTSTQMAVLFVIAAVFAVLLLLGWRTRLVTIVTWLLLISLQARTPPLAYGADGVLRALLFFSMFLPLGARWSIDEMRASAAGEALRADEHRSFACAALIVQIVIIYVFTGLLKLADPSWLRLEGVFYALAGDHHATGIGLALSRFDVVTKTLAALTLLLEIVLPFLLFVPLGVARIRVALVLVFCAFHLITALTMHLGFFPYVSCLAWLALLPKEAWQRAGVSTRAPGDVDIDTHPLRALAVSCAIVLAFAASLESGLRPSSGWQRPAWMRALAQMVALEQRWNMFTRPMHDGWFIIAATPVSEASPLLKDAPLGTREIDVMRGGAPLSYERPAVIAHQFKSMRWRKLFTDMTFERPSSKRNRRVFLRYICRSWNAAAEEGEQIARVDLLFMQVDDKPGGGEEPVRRRVLASRVCGPRAAETNRDSDPYFEMKPEADSGDDEERENADGGVP